MFGEVVDEITKANTFPDYNQIFLLRIIQEKDSFMAIRTPYKPDIFEYTLAFMAFLFFILCWKNGFGV